MPPGWGADCYSPYLIASPKLKKVISNIVIALFFIWIFYFVYQYREDFYKISSISFSYLLPALLLAFCSYVGNGNFLRLMLQKYTITISLQESTAIALLTTFFNTIMPMQSGAALRAVYLKKRHNFNYTSFFVTLYAIYVIVLFNVSCIGIVVSALIYVKYTIISYFVCGLLILGFLVLGTIFIVPVNIPNQNRRLFQLFKKTIDSWNQIRKDKKFVLQLQSLQLINFTIRTLLMYLVFLSMGLSLPIEKVIYFQIITSIMSFINITPGAIGIQETLFLLVGKLFSIKTADILIMSLLLRSVSLAVNFTCAPFASYILFKKDLFALKRELRTKTD